MIMSTGLNDEQTQIQHAARQFLARRITPHVEQWEKTQSFPWEVLEELYELGFVTGVVSEANGGTETGAVVQAILMEEAGRAWGSLRTTLNVQSMVAAVLDRHADSQQRDRYLRPLLRGQSVGAFAATETEAGSDIGQIRTRLEQTGTGYVLNGRKMFITNAADAQFLIVFARHIHPVDGDLGMSAVVVDTHAPGVKIRNLPHLPVRSTSNCDVEFERVELPEDAIIGDPGKAMRIIMKTVNIGRLNIAMGAVGLSQACLDEVTEYVKIRRQFDRPLASFQLVQDLVVKIAVETQSTRLLGYHAAHALESGADTRIPVAMAKLECAEAANRNAYRAVQIFGGTGLMEGSAVERIFRDAREATIPEGTSQIQTLLIGEALLGVSALR